MIFKEDKNVSSKRSSNSILRNNLARATFKSWAVQPWSVFNNVREVMIKWWLNQISKELKTYRWRHSKNSYLNRINMSKRMTSTLIEKHPPSIIIYKTWYWLCVRNEFHWRDISSSHEWRSSFYLISKLAELGYITLLLQVSNGLSQQNICSLHRST